ncbi:MAG: hypothetical protein AVDCRST_MAG12-1816 [uncultured Rubrobacteraceae bacterium]|uniref:DUF1499 domain-containing protein n=1 Tax=uncultured Rubrobacteraceae bacterium TaxID=349277 RepID=A0A6J4RZN2_9ACTN|nr:MAG: hypothetical protein AVDCRST_MAG12-1816 [uncultured Rubrobacteraceae bacterium]
MNERERPTPNSARAARTYPVDPARLLSAVMRAVEGLPRWSLEAAEGNEVRAVRKTRLFRFADDVTARVSPDPDGARLELTSASRVGKGDLGQNPRNLVELLRAVDREAGDPPPNPPRGSGEAPLGRDG